MSKFIAFLRGINVSGHKIIRMEELRKALVKAGFGDVSTYIQSGNVIFSAPAGNDEAPAEKIKTVIKKSFGFDVDTVVRSAKELGKVIKADPFKKIKGVDYKKVYVAFFAEEPQKKLKASFSYTGNDIDAFHIKGKEMFILYNEGMGKSRFTLNYIEKNLGVSATTRNWATVNKMLELTAVSK